MHSLLHPLLIYSHYFFGPYSTPSPCIETSANVPLPSCLAIASMTSVIGPDLPIGTLSRGMTLISSCDIFIPCSWVPPHGLFGPMGSRRKVHKRANDLRTQGGIIPIRDGLRPHLHGEKWECKVRVNSAGGFQANLTARELGDFASGSGGRGSVPRKHQFHR